jgi:hypothetical protein
MYKVSNEGKIHKNAEISVCCSDCGLSDQEVEIPFPPKAKIYSSSTVLTSVLGRGAGVSFPKPHLEARYLFSTTAEV